MPVLKESLAHLACTDLWAAWEASIHAFHAGIVRTLRAFIRSGVLDFSFFPVHAMHGRAIVSASDYSHYKKGRRFVSGADTTTVKQVKNNSDLAEKAEKSIGIPSLFNRKNNI